MAREPRSQGQSSQGRGVPVPIRVTRRAEREQTPGEAWARPPETEGVYVISVAARILQMHPQTLRKYERLGLISPSRSVGMLRLYSERDIARLRLVKHLQEDLGVNLAGVDFILRLLDRLEALRRSLEAMDYDDPFHFRMLQHVRALCRMITGER